MYIKKIIKNDKTYYILNVCDCETKNWSRVFITEKLAITLINNKIKLIEA